MGDHVHYRDPEVKKMLSQAGPECAGGYEYAQSLLRDRYRELQALEIRHHSEQIPTDEYVSCRRSLFQAISELSHIERRQSSARSGPADKPRRTG